MENKASMGPPLFSGGNEALAGHTTAGTLGLQWGRRCSAAEISNPISL